MGVFIIVSCLITINMLRLRFLIQMHQTGFELVRLIIQLCFTSWLGAKQTTAWPNNDLVCWRIYAPLGLDEWTHYGLVAAYGDRDLLSDTKPLSEPMFTSRQWGLVPLHWGIFHMKFSNINPWHESNYQFSITAASHKDQLVKIY